VIAIFLSQNSYDVDSNNFVHQVLSMTNTAVAILHYKNWNDTISCIQSVLADTSNTKDLYIIDNDETKSVPAELKNLLNERVILISNDRNYGFAGGYNRFLEKLLPQNKYQYFWFLNNDTQIKAGSINALLEYSQNHPNSAIIGSKIYKNTPEGQKIQGFGGLLNKFTARSSHVGDNEVDKGQYDNGFKFDYVMGAVMFIPSWYFEKSGLFDETNFLYCEEQDITNTCKKNGWDLGFCPNSKVYHQESSSVGNRSPIHDYYNVRNTLYSAKKNYPLYLPSVFISSIFFNLLPKIAKLQFARIKIVIKGYSDFFLRNVGKLKTFE
jgi:GT2 family glycosyltransferase